MIYFCILCAFQNVEFQIFYSTLYSDRFDTVKNKLFYFDYNAPFVLDSQLFSVWNFYLVTLTPP